MKETLPSFPKAPVPSDDNEFLSINEDRGDRFGVVNGSDPTFFSMLTLIFFFFDLLRFRFARGERIESG